MHFLLYQSHNRWNLQPETTSILSFSLGIVGRQLNCSCVTEGCLSKHWVAFTWGLFRPEFQNLLFCALRRRPCHCRYITIVFFVVAVAVSTHLFVVCRHFCCLMSLFQDHLACWNFTLTSPWTAPPPPPLFEGLSCVVGTSVGKKSTQHFGEEKWC